MKEPVRNSQSKQAEKDHQEQASELSAVSDAEIASLECTIAECRANGGPDPVQEHLLLNYVPRLVQQVKTLRADLVNQSCAAQTEVEAHSEVGMQPWERPPEPCWSCGGDAEARDDIHVRCIDTKGINCEVMDHWYTRKTWNTRASVSAPAGEVEYLKAVLRNEGRDAQEGQNRNTEQMMKLKRAAHQCGG